jgi:hypothetical protein
MAETPRAVMRAALPSQIVFRFAPRDLKISIIGLLFRVGAHTTVYIYIERPLGLEINVFKPGGSGPF